MKKKFKESISLTGDDKLTNQPVDLSNKSSNERTQLLTLDLDIQNSNQNDKEQINIVLSEDENHSDDSVEVLGEFNHAPNGDSLTNQTASFSLEACPDESIYQNNIKDLKRHSIRPSKSLRSRKPLKAFEVLDEILKDSTISRSNDNLYLPLNYDSNTDSSSGICFSRSFNNKFLMFFFFNFEIPRN